MAINVTAPNDLIGAEAFSGPPCTTVKVRCRSGSSVPIEVNVSGLHAAALWIPIAVGEAEVFRLDDRGISSVFVRGVSGVGAADCFQVASTRQ